MLKMRIVEEGPSWVVIDKPAGFHTHPPENKQIRIAHRWNSLGVLERQLGHKLFPMHRLDRATSGLLLFSKERAANRSLQEQFADQSVTKTYFVVVRGHFRGEALIDTPLKDENENLQAASTRVSECFTFQLPLPHPDGGNRIFTVLRARPETGRFHQIRRHLARLGFPVVGDTRHGDRKLNREFAALTGCRPLLLRCMSLEFNCPSSGLRNSTRARWSREWHKLFDLAGACPLNHFLPL